MAAGIWRRHRGIVCDEEVGVNVGRCRAVGYFENRRAAKPPRTILTDNMNGTRDQPSLGAVRQ